jgi:hypothetical protein
MSIASAIRFRLITATAPKNRHPRFAAVIGAIASVAVLLMGWTGTCLAQETASSYLEPRVERQHFDTLCQRLDLGRDQRIVVESLFSDYQAALTQAAKAADEQAIAAGRQTVNDAFAGKSRITADDLKQKRMDVLNVYRTLWPVADNALHDLLSGIEALITPEQEPRLVPAIRELNRSIYLHPRQVASQLEEYAGDGVDVIRLVADARKEGGELQPLAPGSLDAVLAQYELQLDQFLQRTSSEYRSGKFALKIAAMAKDGSAAAEQQAAVARWKQLYQLNQSAVKDIAAIAQAEISPLASQQWLDRFDTACFAWMYPRKKPDRQYEWMTRQKLSADQRQAADDLYNKYIARRKELNKQAIEIMMRGRMELQTMLYFTMAPPDSGDRAKRSLYDELLKNSGEQATLETNTSFGLEAILDEGQRKALRDAMKLPDAKRR